MGRRKTNHVHSYVEYNTDTDTSSCLVEGCTYILKGNHSSNLLRHFGTHHYDLFQEIQEKNMSAVELSPRISNSHSLHKLNAKGSSRFKKIRNLCIQLVTVHNRPISLIDDEAFQNLLAFAGVSDYERRKLTSKTLKIAIESQNKNGDSNDEDEEDDDDDNDMNMEELIPMTKVKGEAKSNDHEKPYMSFFSVTAESAICSICEIKIGWSSVEELKHHLLKFHPTVSFKDDDAAFEVNSFGDGSNAEMEEIYLDEDLFDSRPNKRAKKRKLEENSLSSSSLDRFGLYVASLLKQLPPKKCIKFQGQIIQRLLREQME